MTNRKPQWREIFSGKTNVLASVIAITVNVYVFNTMSDFLLVYLIRFVSEPIAKLILLIPTTLLMILVYYIVARITHRFIT